MKNLARTIWTVVGILAVVVILSSCETDDSADQCVTTAYAVSTAKVSNTVKKSATEIQSPLSQDIYIEGDAVVQGDLQTNGYSIQVMGDLWIKGNYDGAVMSTIFASEELKVNGNINVNQGVMICNSLHINGNVNGQGFIFWCESKFHNGNVNNNQSEPVIQQDCGEVLTDDAPNYDLVTVPCSYVGQTIGGVTYIQANSYARVGDVLDCELHGSVVTEGCSICQGTSGEEE